MLTTLDGQGPLYLQLYRALKGAVLDGTLAPGTRLPATRVLADEAGLSRNVVLLAYQHLGDEGYVETRRGDGTYVAPALPELRAAAEPGTAEGRRRPPGPRLSAFGRRLDEAGPFPASTDRHGGPDDPPPRLPLDFRYGCALPDPTTLKVWRRLLARRARDLPLDYASPQGSPELRTAVAEHLGRHRGLRIEKSRIVITGGSQQALDLVVRLLTEPGDAVAMEDPGYRGARQLFEASGLRVCSCPVDGRGIDPDDLHGLDPSPRWVYITPSHQFPTGAVLPMERRLALLDWADAHDAYVLEDDYDSEFRYQGPPLEAVAALDRRRRVIYAGTFSKVLFPALRLGWLVLPEPLVRPFVAAKRLTDRHSPSLEQAVLADFFAEGHFDRHLRRMRRRGARRLAVFLEVLGELFGDRAVPSSEAAGIHLMVTFPRDEPRTVESWIHRAAERGLGLYGTHVYYADSNPPAPGLLFGFANLDEGDIQRALARFADVVHGRKGAPSRSG